MSESEHLPAELPHRVEHDSMGEVRVPAEARWGAQTQRAVENFPISGQRLEPRLIRALALVKGQAALVNASLKSVPQVDRRIGRAIFDAAEEVAEGFWDDQFPVDVFQTGSGTSSNMNMNEVLANLASERLGEPRAVHPNDHVNASQSSNDVFPSAIHIAVVEGVLRDLVPALEVLYFALRRKEKEFRDVVKAGRTHLMDATPVTLGQEFGGYAAQVHASIVRLQEALPRCGELPLGGTAVGTGINSPKQFAPKVIAALAERLALPLTEARNHFAAQGSRDPLVEMSGEMRTLAVALIKIANDLRWMGSGPRAGLAEIFLPDLQPGSSIMPGKVNPVIPEAVTQVAVQVIGNDAAVAFAGSQGNFELNVYMPMMARNLIESIRLLANVSELFAKRCIEGIRANGDRLRQYAEASPSIGTALNPYIGYERAAEVIKESVRTGRSIREIVRERGLMTDEELDRALDVMAMTRGGII
ncbi:class II fumarate hydratase [Rhabdothermincola sediminis]|uniref:class II fumarate hydratase n=1 Tax=Rhabdothermincola sediminis TaxID=2751370 RepID=UPI0027DA7548|nr:class II fumarate hydratase [Rhabdothermincola sediminis]